MADIPQTDVSRRVALPTARIVSRSAQPSIDQNSDEYLEAIEEEWNKKVDVEVETLVDGMVDLVGLASVSSVYTHATCVLNYCRLETRTSFASRRRHFKHSVELNPWCVQFPNLPARALTCTW